VSDLVEVVNTNTEVVIDGPTIGNDLGFAKPRMSLPRRKSSLKAKVPLTDESSIESPNVVNNSETNQDSQDSYRPVTRRISILESPEANTAKAIAAQAVGRRSSLRPTNSSPAISNVNSAAEVDANKSNPFLDMRRALKPVAGGPTAVSVSVSVSVSASEPVPISIKSISPQPAEVEVEAGNRTENSNDNSQWVSVLAPVEPCDGGNSNVQVRRLSVRAVTPGAPEPPPPPSLPVPKNSSPITAIDQ
jgi:hypothetical protein